MLKKNTANENNHIFVMTNEMLDHLYMAHSISQRIYNDEKVDILFSLLAESIKKNIDKE